MRADTKPRPVDPSQYGRTLASKKSLAPMTPSVDTLISDSLASAIRPLSSCSSPAAALRKISRN